MFSNIIVDDMILYIIYIIFDIIINQLINKDIKNIKILLIIKIQNK
jgi:hypothetical protein